MDGAGAAVLAGTSLGPSPAASPCTSAVSPDAAAGSGDPGSVGWEDASAGSGALGGRHRRRRWGRPVRSGGDRRGRRLQLRGAGAAWLRPRVGRSSRVDGLGREHNDRLGPEEGRRSP